MVRGNTYQRGSTHWHNTSALHQQIPSVHTCFTSVAITLSEFPRLFKLFHYYLRIVTGENHSSSCSVHVMAGALCLCYNRTFIFADGAVSLQPIHFAISIYFRMISKQNSYILPVKVNILIKIIQRRWDESEHPPIYTNLACLANISPLPAVFWPRWANWIVHELLMGSLLQIFIHTQHSLLTFDM